jgi:hypothetical protein
MEDSSMTEPKDQAATKTDRQSKVSIQGRDDDKELDAEIVRDLEADDQAANARGGKPCNNTAQAL